MDVGVDTEWEVQRVCSMCCAVVWVALDGGNGTVDVVG